MCVCVCVCMAFFSARFHNAIVCMCMRVCEGVKCVLWETSILQCQEENLAVRPQIWRMGFALEISPPLDA